MKKMRVTVKIYLLLIILAATTIIKGQPVEMLNIHTDRIRFISGEDLWFSIYNTDEATGLLTSTSQIAYAELINPWNIPVVRLRIKLTEGRGNGSFPLPDSLSSGEYTLRVYTNRMKDNLPSGCAMKVIGVYSPFRGSSYLRKSSIADSLCRSLHRSLRRSLHNTGEKAIIVSDTSFGRREKVSVKILTERTGSVTPEFYDMSVSVAPSSVSDTIPEFGRNNGSLAHSSLNDFESEGHFLSLRIRSRDGNSTGRHNRLFMSVQGKVAGFRYAEMDSSGRFTFILPVDSKQRTFIVQPEIPDNEMSLEIESSFAPVMPESGYFKDSLRGKESEVFESLSFNHQANRIYGIKSIRETDGDEPGNLLKRRFYGIPEMEIFLNDYIKLPDMTEVFFELLPGILLREGKNGYEVKITNPLTGIFYEEPPLVMIDGVILNDLNVLAGLDPELVEKIEVVKTPYLTGDLILHGIVNVITRSGDFSKITMPDYAAIFPYRVAEPGYDFISPSYNEEQSGSARKPDLRNTIYWNPSVWTDPDGIAAFEFWTPDVPGRYSVTVMGISGSGKKISAIKSFNVK